MRARFSAILASASICLLLISSAGPGQAQLPSYAPPVEIGASATAEDTPVPGNISCLWRRRLLHALITRAHLIMLGEVTAVDSALVQKSWGEVIESDITVSADEVLKGSTALGSQSNVVLTDVLGGRVGDTIMRASTTAFYRPEERVILFLEQESGLAAGADGGWQVVNGTMGKLTVDGEGNVAELGMSWIAARTVILSYLSGSRVHLPLVVSDAPMSDDDPEALVRAEPAAVRPSSPAFDVYDGVVWPGDYPRIDYYIWNPGFNDAEAGSLAQQNRALRRGAEAWGRGGEARTNFKLVYKGPTAINSVQQDGTNVVSVHDVTDPSGNIAVCFSWFSLSGDILEADIIFYDEPFTFAVHPGGDPALIDIESVAVHEFGHFVGLDHSAVPGATMWPSYDGGTVHNRTLHLDDMMGIRSMYGSYYEVHDQDETQDAEQGEHFGSSLAVGDFNGDGEDDLAVGVPHEGLTSTDEGNVCIYLGDGVAGLDGWFCLTQLGDPSETGDQFGYALAAGDFDNDGYDDLAVGTPYEDWGGSDEAGIVFVFPGEPDPSVFGSPVILHQGLGGGGNETEDRFGYALAAGDFDDDGYDDLAVGVPYEDFTATDNGVAFIFRGSGSGLGDGYFIHQGLASGANETGDHFGWALAAGDFNGDDRDDLAVGAPHENVSTGVDAGLVFIFEGTVGTLGNGYYIDQRPAGGNETSDHFGYTLAAGDLNGDGDDDLVVGVPDENYHAVDEGVVFLFRGNPGTLDKPRVVSQAAASYAYVGDRFGLALAMGDFNDDGRSEVAIGCPQKDDARGHVYIYQHRDDSGENAVVLMELDQSTTGSGYFNDQFGAALAVGDFSGNGSQDLAIAAPNKDGAVTDIGKVFIWRDRP